MAAAPVRTRIAPTPSGWLHLGNAWSFVLTWLLARGRGGSIHLRIDDLDAARFREEYLEDIFASLAWLGLDWDSGPRDAADFRARHSQRLRLAEYRAALDHLALVRDADGPVLYACACSRAEIRRASAEAASSGRYPGTCRSRGLPLGAAGAALRLRVPDGEAVDLADGVAGTLRLYPAREAGDFVVRTREGDPAYQLASVVDDEALGMTLVVRGRDLLPSTAAQLHLARRLGARGFSTAAFVHHGLVTSEGADGGKLSKSAGGRLPGPASLVALRAGDADAGRVLGFIAGRLGMDPARRLRAADLLRDFHPGRIPAGDIRWEDFASGGP